MQTFMPPAGQRCGSYPFLYLAEDTGVPYRHVLALADFWKTRKQTVWHDQAVDAICAERGYVALVALDRQICLLSGVPQP